jgi:hypothetical protein
MAATVQIHEMSALATGTNKTSGSIRFKDADNATVDLNNPLVIPGAGTIYSYTKKLRPYISVAPDTQVDNFRWYTDGSSGWGTGVGAAVKNLGVTWGANYKTVMSGGADLFGYVTGSPLDGDGTDVSPFTTTGYHGDLIEVQMSVASNAVRGVKAAETLTFAYDEI